MENDNENNGMVRKKISSVERTRKLSVLLRHHRLLVSDFFFGLDWLLGIHSEFFGANSLKMKILTVLKGKIF